MEMTNGTMRTTRALFVTVVVAPPVMGMVFVPIFRSVQAWGLPSGSLESVDLTPFARRDELMMGGFALALLTLVVTMGFRARTWRSRAIMLVVGGVAAVGTYLAVFVSLLAG
jgi:hypothetical protein